MKESPSGKFAATCGTKQNAEKFGKNKREEPGGASAARKLKWHDKRLKPVKERSEMAATVIGSTPPKTARHLDGVRVSSSYDTMDCVFFIEGL